MNIQIIWYGNMAKAIVSSLILYVSENNIKNIHVHIHDRKDISEYILDMSYVKQWIYTDADVIILAVKPQSLDSIDLCVYNDHATLVSILAWTRIDRLYQLKWFATIARCLPSMLMQVGKGSAWWVQRWKSEWADFTKNIFSYSGTVFTYEKESQLDDHWVLFGSWPAYIPMVMELLATASHTLDLWLSQQAISDGIYEMVVWTIAYMQEQNIWASELMSRVMSKGWTTQAFREKLQSWWWEKLLAESLQANKKRVEELSK